MGTAVAMFFLSVYTVLVFAAYVPQIVKILKTKSANDLSMTSWLTWIVADLCYLIYALLESPEPGIIFIVCLDLSFILIASFLTGYYQKKHRRKHR